MMNLELLENKKPRLKNRGFFAALIIKRITRVDLSTNLILFLNYLNNNE